MLAYRIVHKKYSKQLFASGLQGRWNSSGKKVVYLAESIALAFLENMVRRQGVGFNDDFNIMIVQWPDNIKTTQVHAEHLKSGWSDFRDYAYCQSIGDEWYDKGETLVLKVPSAVVPNSYNYILNSIHPDFNKINLLEATQLVPDKRIEDILKKYGG